MEKTSSESVFVPEKGSKFKVPFLQLTVLLIVILLGISFFFLMGKGKTQKTTQETEKTSTTSAALPSGICGTDQEYINQKQGYRLCYPEGWQKGELKASSLTVGFDPKAITENFPGTISVTVSDTAEDVAIQDIINNASKYEYGKTTVDKVNATQVVYTRGRSDSLYDSYKNVIDTVVLHFGRTYVVRLNTNTNTLEADEAILNKFLESWKFIDSTQNPPWSSSHNILVNTPWFGDTISNPITVSGEAIAFEAVVSIRLKDNDGHVLAQNTAMAESGTSRSAFSAQISYDKPTTKEGVLEVYTNSAYDGSEQDLVKIDIVFP